MVCLQDNNILKLENLSPKTVFGDVTLWWKSETHSHDIIVFTNLFFYSLHNNNNSIVFYNLHFETYFEKCGFSGHKKF